LGDLQVKNRAQSQEGEVLKSTQGAANITGCNGEKRYSRKSNVCALVRKAWLSNTLGKKTRPLNRIGWGGWSLCVDTVGEALRRSHQGDDGDCE